MKKIKKTLQKIFKLFFQFFFKLIYGKIIYQTDNLISNQIKIDEQKPIIVCVMDEKYLKNYYEILKILRNNNINSEIFLDSKKNLGKQLTFANKKQCPVAVICGENEFKDNTITLKNLLGTKGENNQVTFSKENLINEIKKFI